MESGRDWGSEPTMAGCDQQGVDYLFKLRMTRGVRKVVEKAMDGPVGGRRPGPVGTGEPAAARRLEPVATGDPVAPAPARRRRGHGSRKTPDGQGELLPAEPGAGAEVWEFAVLVTSLDLAVRSLAQLNRDRADSENLFDELKNQWGWAPGSPPVTSTAASTWPG